MRYASIRGFAVAAASAATLICFGYAPIVQAQSLRLRATIPFDFHVGSEIFPAGMYDIKLIAGAAIQMFTDKGKVIAASSTTPVSNRAEKSGSRLVFNKYGDDHFLSEVHWSGYSIGRGLFMSRGELEIARNTTRKRVVASVVGP